MQSVLAVNGSNELRDIVNTIRHAQVDQEGGSPIFRQLGQVYSFLHEILSDENCNGFVSIYLNICLYFMFQNNIRFMSTKAPFFYASFYTYTFFKIKC